MTLLGAAPFFTYNKAVMLGTRKPPFTDRLYALLIDYCLILAYMCCLAGLAWATYLMSGRLPDWLKYGVTAAEVMGFIVLVLPVGLYLYFCETSRRRATVGKRVMRLTVTANTGKTSPSKRQIAVRTIVKLIPWELAHFFVWHTVAVTRNGQSAFPLWLEIGLVCCLILPAAYLLIVAIQPRGRGPHDLVAGTRVVATIRS